MAIRKKRRLVNRKKRNLDPKTVIDYKRPDVLKRFVTDRGKIIPRRISGATAKQQRDICVAIKRARYLSILPYSVAHRSERGFVGMVSLSYSGFDRTRSRGGYERKPFNRSDRPDSNRSDRPDDNKSSNPAPSAAPVESSEKKDV